MNKPSAGRPCNICTHPKQKQIGEWYARQKSISTIAAHFGVGKRSLQRHFTNHLPGQLAKVMVTRKLETADHVLTAIEHYMVYARRMYESCNDYLLDPGNPKRYYLGPRAEDLEVVYMVDNGEGHPTKQKALLSSLLAQVPDVFSVNFKMADPRELILRTALILNRQLELIAKIQGHIKSDDDKHPGAVFNITINGVWQEFKSIILKATEGHPEVRKALVKELDRAASP